MLANPTEQAAAGPERFHPRKIEMQALADILPLAGIDARSKRVINVWGDERVGKSTFLSELRESELLSRKKILWIRPARDETKLDTVAEFIGACGKTLRYPASPEKEEEIAQTLEQVRQGKVNPLVSDDSILITRSAIAANKKPYINQAAAASVGRTEVQREEVQVSVGLGESKANNQAEGFLDALPLQSLGTDLIVLYIERLERLSITVRDWLRDYVIPAATRGAYRRNLVFLVESLDPARLVYPNENWGEWDGLREEYRLPPLSEDDIYQHCILAGLTPDRARYVCRVSLGFPEAMQSAIERARDGKLAGPAAELAKRLLGQLSEADRLKLGALCLPDRLYSDEADALFGRGAGRAALQWLSALPDSPLAPCGDGQGHCLPEPFRCQVLGVVSEIPEFKPYRQKWAPLARFIHSAPDRTTRANLMVFSLLQWFDAPAANDLFGAKADKVMDFVTRHPLYFNRNQERYRVSERLRHDLAKVAEATEHPTANATRANAQRLWDARRSKIKAQIQSLEIELAKRQDEVNRLERRHSENAALLRIQERKSGGIYDESVATAAAKPNRGPLILILETVAVVIFAGCYFAPEPYNFIGLVLALAALATGLGFVPEWLARRRAVALARHAMVSDSPENLRKRNIELTHDIQRRGTTLDDLKQNLAAAKSDLLYPYVD